MYKYKYTCAYIHLTQRELFKYPSEVTQVQCCMMTTLVDIITWISICRLVIDWESQILMIFCGWLAVGSRRSVENRLCQRLPIYMNREKRSTWKFVCNLIEVIISVGSEPLAITCINKSRTYQCKSNRSTSVMYVPIIGQTWNISKKILGECRVDQPCRNKLSFIS